MIADAKLARKIHNIECSTHLRGISVAEIKSYSKRLAEGETVIGARHLPVKLSVDEIRGYEEQLTHRQIFLEDMCKEQKEVMESYEERIKSIKDEISRLAKCVLSKTELRIVGVEIIWDQENNRASVRRIDTGETIEERFITPEERGLRFGEVV